MEKDKLQKDKLILIDGNSLANRAYYALPPLTTLDGVPSQAVYGFANMLIKIITDIRPKYIAVAFDLPKPTFRHTMYSEYKAGRKKSPDELNIQFPLLKDMLTKMKIAIIERETFEADDIIGTMAKTNDVMTYIVTGDRDSLQLIDESTTVLLTKKGISEIAEVDEKVLLSEFRLTPAQVIDYKSLAGDSSDNIPGVKGVGEKTALELIASYGSLDEIYNNIDSIKGKLQERLLVNKETAYMSRTLATIITDMDLNVELNSLCYPFPFDNGVREYFTKLGFKTLVKRGELFTSSDSAVNKAFKQPSEVELIADASKIDEILKDCKIMAIDVGDHISLAIDGGKEYIINLAYSLIDMGLDYNVCLSKLRPYLEDENIVKVVCDAKALKKTLFSSKTELNNYWDVKLAQYLVDMSVDYSNLQALLNVYGIDEREAATGLLFLKDNLEKELSDLKMHRLYYDIELPLEQVLFDMERLGFKLDQKRLGELAVEYSNRIEKQSKIIFDLAGKIFNINSPKQLGKVLFEDLNIPYPKKTVNYSTGAEILEQVEDKHQIVREVLNYRTIAKLYNTYIEGLRKLADGSGIIHTEFRQMMTTTGRLSSVEPNLQNIPVRDEEGKALRALFTAREGYTFVAADYSQIELRLMAHFSGDSAMMEAYANNIDIHTATASKVFDIGVDEVTSSMRRTAKAVNFGIIYGISEYGLAQNLKISNLKAREYINAYFEKYPKVKEYLDASVAKSKETGTASTLLGRIRRIPELHSPNYNVRQFGERAAMNMPLQGSAADIIKIAMLKVSKALKGLKSALILQIHDELIVEAADDEVALVKQILIDNMTRAVELNVPLTVDVGVGKNWFDCK